LSARHSPRERPGVIGWKDFTTSVENYRGGERRDYHVTIDMAKELAMVERNDARGPHDAA